MSDILASLVVSFGDGADSSESVMLELDPELNGDKTSFSPGDEIFFRLQHDESVHLKRMAATDGMVDAQGAGVRTIEQQLLWVDLDEEHVLSYFPRGGVDYGSYGNTVTGLRRVGSRSVEIKTGVFPALAWITYPATFLLFRLLAPVVELAEDETYPITIVAYMESAA